MEKNQCRPSGGNSKLSQKMDVKKLSLSKQRMCVVFKYVSLIRFSLLWLSDSVSLHSETNDVLHIK